jgi:hypothetical protein
MTPDPDNEPIFDRDERVMVMGDITGWKVELWAHTGGDSITLKDNFATMDEAENWADEVRAILLNWDEWS